jgi:hypothetical protein
MGGQAELQLRVLGMDSVQEPSADARVVATPGFRG